MSKTQITSRFIQKHDLEVNWLKAVNFVPMQGELIIYDIEVDENGDVLKISDGNGGQIDCLPRDEQGNILRSAFTYERFKIGDGIKNVNELPFISAITKVSALPSKIDAVDPNTFYQVSNPYRGIFISYGLDESLPPSELPGFLYMVDTLPAVGNESFSEFHLYLCKGKTWAYTNNQWNQLWGTLHVINSRDQLVAGEERSYFLVNDKVPDTLYVLNGTTIVGEPNFININNAIINVDTLPTIPDSSKFYKVDEVNCGTLYIKHDDAEGSLDVNIYQGTPIEIIIVDTLPELGRYSTTLKAFIYYQKSDNKLYWRLIENDGWMELSDSGIPYQIITSTDEIAEGGFPYVMVSGEGLNHIEGGLYIWDGEWKQLITNPENYVTPDQMLQAIDTAISWGSIKDLLPECNGNHAGEWITDGDYEYRICNICGRKQVREKNTPIDFEGDTIPYNKNKFSVTVGALKGEGEPSVEAGEGLTEFGNARDKFTLVDDAENKVLKIYNNKDNAANYNSSSVKCYLTDTLHSKSTGVDGGQYLVCDFDMKFDKFTGTNSGKTIFTLKTCEALGGNWLTNIIFYNYNGKLRVGNTNYVANADGAYADTWFTFRSITTLQTDGTSKATTALYYKVKNAEGPMTLLTNGVTSNAGDAVKFGQADRVDSHFIRFDIGSNDYDYTYYLDNISFIRTADASYTCCECEHEIEEIIVPATAATDGTVTRRCTIEGCKYVENEIIPSLPNPSTLIKYGPEYLQASANMGVDTKLSVGKADIITDKHLIFNADVTSFAGIRIGHGYQNYSASYIEIDNTSMKYYFYGSKGAELRNELAHGLNINNNIKVTIDVDYLRHATIVIRSRDAEFTFTTSTNWYGTNGEIYAQSLGSVLPNAQLAFTCDRYNADIQFYGDSYLGQSSDRWLYSALSNGYVNALFDGYAGRGSSGAYLSLIENLKYSDPSIIVWMMGMNDGSDININTPNAGWAATRDKLISISREYGFEIVFTTIPTVPEINHEGKNKWIRESGYRYIDMAEAVGADGTGAWTDGYLHSDNVHPTASGALAIYTQVIKDFPDMKYIKN